MGGKGGGKRCAEDIEGGVGGVGGLDSQLLSPPPTHSTLRMLVQEAAELLKDGKKKKGTG